MLIGGGGGGGLVIYRSGASYSAFSFLFRFLFAFFIELHQLSISGLGGFANSSVAGM